LFHKQASSKINFNCGQYKPGNESRKAPESSAVKQRTITALFNWKAQTLTSDTAISQHTLGEPEAPIPAANDCSSEW
jgi:hypothetical protein